MFDVRPQCVHSASDLKGCAYTVHIRCIDFQIGCLRYASLTATRVKPVPIQLYHSPYRRDSRDAAAMLRRLYKDYGVDRGSRLRTGYRSLYRRPQRAFPLPPAATTDDFGLMWDR